ncbi:MAG: hypothetical protein WC352_05690 [Candidatus Omnitrophota bacterium]|jgi:cell division protein FtsL
MKLIDFNKLAEHYQRMSKREKLILIVTATFVAIFLLDQVIIGPVYRTLRSVDRKIIDLEANIKQSIRLLGQKEQMMKEAEYYADFAHSAKSSEEGTLVLLKHIQEIASQVSVNLLYVKPAGGGPENKESNIYRVNLECEGQMDQIVNFFYAIENSKMLMQLEKFSLQPVAKGSSVIRCSATVALTGVP